MNLPMGTQAYERERVLSWQVMAELLKKVDGNVSIEWSDMGTGMYDCLCLLVEGNLLLSMNRAGENTLIGDELKSGTWERASRSPSAAASHILLGSEVDRLGSMDSVREELLRKVVSVGNWLGKYFYKNEFAWVSHEANKLHLMIGEYEQQVVDLTPGMDSIADTGFRIERDQDGLPAVHLGYHLTATQFGTGKVVSESIVTASDARKQYRILSEELLDVTLEPIFTLDEMLGAE